MTQIVTDGGLTS